MWFCGVVIDFNKPMSLSAVILTHNETEKIRRSLESIRWIPDIVIVDDQSSDNTITLCKQYTDKIIVRPLENDFAAQRNKGIELAEGPWILQLDADETIPKETQQVIESALKQNSNVSGYSLIRRNYFLGREMRYGGWREKCVKLFRKGEGWYKGRVHESLLIQGKIEPLAAFVNHYPFEKFSDCIEKLNRYTSIEAEMMWRENPNYALRDILYQMTYKSLKLFWKIYIKKQGFREGFIGFVFSCFWALGHMVRWAKYWECANHASRI